MRWICLFALGTRGNEQQMSCGLHHEHNVNTKRDLNSRLCPPAPGHAELLGEVFPPPRPPALFHGYSELPAVQNST